MLKPKIAADRIELPSDFVPGEFDVVVTKGPKYRNHSGNKLLDQKVESKKFAYATAGDNRKSKAQHITTVVEEVVELSSVGGFVAFNQATGKWYLLDATEARGRVATAFRKALVAALGPAKPRDKKIIQQKAHKNSVQSTAANTAVLPPLVPSSNPYAVSSFACHWNAPAPAGNQLAQMLEEFQRGHEEPSSNTAHQVGARPVVTPRAGMATQTPVGLEEQISLQHSGQKITELKQVMAYMSNMWGYKSAEVNNLQRQFHDLEGQVSQLHSWGMRLYEDHARLAAMLDLGGSDASYDFSGVVLGEKAVVEGTTEAV